MLQDLSLKTALGTVIEISESWYSFGIQLGMSKKVLDGIKHERSLRSMIDVLDKWLNANQDASWKILFKAKNRLVYRMPESSDVSFKFVFKFVCIKVSCLHVLLLKSTLTLFVIYCMGSILLISNSMKFLVGTRVQFNECSICCQRH